MGCDKCEKLKAKVDALLKVNAEWVKRYEKLEEAEAKTPGSLPDAVNDAREARKSVQQWEDEYYYLAEISQGYKRKIKELEEELEHAEKLLDKHMHEDD